jgi:hypothetical protein
MSYIPARKTLDVAPRAGYEARVGRRKGGARGPAEGSLAFYRREWGEAGFKPAASVELARLSYENRALRGRVERLEKMVVSLVLERSVTESDECVLSESVYPLSED